MEQGDHFWVRHRGCCSAGSLDRLTGARARWWSSDAEPAACCPLGKRDSGRSLRSMPAARCCRARACGRAATIVQADVCATPLGGAVRRGDGIRRDRTRGSRRVAVGSETARPARRTAAGVGACVRVALERHGRTRGTPLPVRPSLLRAELQRNGWRYDGHTYYQCLLFPLVYLSRRFAGGSLRARAPARAAAQPRARVDQLDRDGGVEPIRVPFGSSLVAWATRA